MNLYSLFSKYYHQFGFQDSATSLMEGIVELHAFVCFFLLSPNAIQMNDNKQSEKSNTIFNIR